MQEIDHFLKGFLGLVLSGHILKRDTGLLLHIDLGITAAHAHNTAALAHTSHKEAYEHPYEDERDTVYEDRRYQRIGYRNLLLFELDSRLQKTVGKPFVIHGSSIEGILYVFILLLLGCDLNLARIDHHLFDLTVINLLYEFIIAYLLVRTCGYRRAHI